MHVREGCHVHAGDTRRRLDVGAARQCCTPTCTANGASSDSEKDLALWLASGATTITSVPGGPKGRRNTREWQGCPLPTAQKTLALLGSYDPPPPRALGRLSHARRCTKTSSTQPDQTCKNFKLLYDGLQALGVVAVVVGDQHQRPAFPLHANSKLQTQTSPKSFTVACCRDSYCRLQTTHPRMKGDPKP